MNREEKKELLRRKELAKFRFKSLCRKVMINAYWLSAIEDTTMGSNPRRNINIIVRRSGRKGIITLKEKAIFSTPNCYRSVEDMERIKVIIHSLKCFDMIPPKIRDDLVEVCNFLYCKPEKVILREGHHASALYFILDGEINVSKMEYCIETGKVIDKVNYALVPGDFFGVDGLILGNRRAVTCTAALHTELLYIYKEDVSDQLRRSLEILWEQIRTSLKRFDYYFGHFTEQQIIECCTFSKIKQYQLDDIVCDDDEGKRNTSFFLLSGKCSILEYLKMKYEIANNQKHFVLLDVKEIHSKTNSEKKSVMGHQSDHITNETFPIYFDEKLNKIEEEAFVDIGTLSAGSIFGIGENLIHRSIVAKNVVQCLEIPRFWLLQRSQNIGNVWKRTKHFYDTTIPSRKMVFDDFVRSNKWTQHRGKTVKELFHLKSKL